MMGDRFVMQESLLYEFRLEAYVPADHMLRAIDRFVDLSDLRRHLALSRLTVIRGRSRFASLRLQLIAITGTIAIITDGPARARQCSHTGLPLLFMAGSGPAPEGLRKGEAGWPVALAGRTRFARECAASSRL